MSIVVLNTDLVPVGIVDTHESFIWTERYYAYGDFEIYMPATREALDLLQLDRYISIPTSNKLMIVESRHIVANVESGDYLTIAGRSLESILTRRVIWDEISFAGNLQDAIHTLLNNNIISPTLGDRRIPNFVFQASSDERITCLAINAKYCGDSLYTIITEICDNYKIGFKIELNSSNQFVFSLYKGNNRSYSQDTYPYVVFSKQYENIISSDFSEDSKELKNVALVGGEIIEDEPRKFTSVGEATGLNRREVFVDASSINSKDGEEDLPAEVYDQKLKNKGTEELVTYAQVTDIDAEVDFSVMYKADEDYFLGDEVQVIDEYNIDTRARVTEYIISYSDTGTCVRPTFSIEENYKLPDIYQEVEYISSTGNAYINLAIIPTKGMVGEVLYRFTSMPSSIQRVFGYYRDDAPNYSSSATYDKGAWVKYNGTYYKSLVAIEEPEEWTAAHWTQDDPGYRWQCGVDTNGVLNTNGYFAYSQTNPTLWTTAYGNYNVDQDGASVYLFARDRYDTNAAEYICSNLQVKSVIIRKDGSTIAHLVPCYRKLDGKPGMYDISRNVFFTSIGSNEFDVGPNVGNVEENTIDDFVPPEYQKLEYIEADGACYIDTGIVTRSIGDRINYDCHFYANNYVENRYFYGAQRTAEGNSLLYGAVGYPASSAGDYISVEYAGSDHLYSPKAQDVLMTSSLVGSKNTVTVNGSVKELNVGTNLELNTLLIFACWNTSGVVEYYSSTLRMHYLMVKNGENVVACYLPVRRKADGEVGVYEIIQGKFIGKSGSGTLTAGPDVAPMFMGPYDVTPDFQDIVLGTKDHNMSNDITVRKISNKVAEITSSEDELTIS